MISLLHDVVVLQQQIVPHLLCHLEDVEGGIKVNLSYLCKEILVVEWWCSWIWKGSFLEDMVPIQDVVVETWNKLAMASSFKE
jgi:hypothetical protein